MQTDHFIFRLDPALKGALASKARATGQSMSEIIREAVRERVLVN